MACSISLYSNNIAKIFNIPNGGELIAGVSE
jgi:hypothetical protein